MSQKKTTYSKQQYVSEIKRRLGYVHQVDDTYIVSKNLVQFKVNGVDIFMHKDKDPDTGILKTIIETTHEYTEDEDNMFPCSFENAQAKNFVEEEVVAAVNALDRHFIEKIGLDPDHQAICSMYNSIKYALLPCFVTDFTETEYVEKVQQEILYLLSHEAIAQSQYTEKGITLCFLGKNIDTDIYDKAFVFLCTDTELKIYIVNYDGKISITSVEDKNIKEYTLKYADYQNNGMTLAVKKILKTHYAFQLQEIVFNDDQEKEIVEEKTKE